MPSTFVRWPIQLLAASAMFALNCFWNGGLNGDDSSFKRIATYPVFENTSIENETVSEIVSVSKDGNTLIYTDSALEAIGFVDISSPEVPLGLGTLPLNGEPTSVSVAGPFALVGVNTSADFVNTSGELVVIHIATQTTVRTIQLGGQPDSVAVSPDEKFCVIAIENERDEDLGSGEPPQSPPGSVVIVDMISLPAFWLTRNVDLVGVPDLFPSDPEPEFVAINENNIAAVTMQENNHVVLLDLEHLRWLRILSEAFGWGLNGAKIESDFSCGSVAVLENIDTDDDGIVVVDEYLFNVPREPDAITWIGNRFVATANEGDLFGGSRGFSIFDTQGNIVYDSASELEHLAMSIGHYPEGRSDNKGTEPESIVFDVYNGTPYLFVGSERGSFVAVYELPRGVLRGSSRSAKPKYKQVLPTGIGPEGLLAIPGRNLLVVASEEDDRDDTFRASLSIFELGKGKPTYPTLESKFVNGLPIPWAALSALAADPKNSNRMYSVQDSFFLNSKIFEIQLSKNKIPTIVDVIDIVDSAGNPVSLDPEGIAVRPGGGFWVACEGDDSPPIPNRLLNVDEDGVIQYEVQLPAALQAERTNNGFEGVAVVKEQGDEIVYACIQREWDDPSGLVKIARYDVEDDSWTFAHYPLEAPTSPQGGWVGLSEITSIGGGLFAIIERDNQAGADARIKLITVIDVEEVEFAPFGQQLPLLSKTIVRDLIPDLEAPKGAIIEKVEGLSMQRNGDVYIITDNDGVDDSNGETQLINLGKIFK